jgi:uncharacterized protein (UPF0218 family)
MNGDGPASDRDADVVLRLPAELRSEFKEPLGPVFTDAGNLLSRAGDPIVAVGDVVTYHLREAGRVPDLAVVDGYTERERATEEVRNSVLVDEDTVENPAATLSAGLLEAIRAGVDAGEPTTVVVEGEEDLATVPAVLVAPDGASVVYGQPGEGMVLVSVDAETRAQFGALFDRLAGDPDRARSLLGVGTA